MTLDLARDVVSWVLIGGGGIFLVIGAVGLNRMPDVFTRMHATSVSDTFGAGLMLLGMMAQGGFSLVTAKLLLLLLFLCWILRSQTTERDEDARGKTEHEKEGERFHGDTSYRALRPRAPACHGRPWRGIQR